MNISRFHKNLLKQWCKEHNLPLAKCIKKAINSKNEEIRMRALFFKTLNKR